MALSKQALLKLLSDIYHQSKKNIMNLLESPVLDEILDNGAEKANAIASATLRENGGRDGTRRKTVRISMIADNDRIVQNRSPNNVIENLTPFITK